MKDKRIYYLDFIRIIAIIAVIVIHVTAQNWYNIALNSTTWTIFNIYNSIVRWAVPILVMISGALFLDKQIDLKKIYQKNIARIIISFIFWSLIYAIIDYSKGYALKSVFESILIGHYHMWYLYMIAGLYILVPLLKKIIVNESTTKYCLIITMIFGILIPELTEIITLYYPGAGRIIKVITNNISFLTSLGYIFYFVLGYYLSKKQLDNKKSTILYFLGLISLIVTIILSLKISQLHNKSIGIFSANLTINIACTTMAIFMFTKKYFLIEKVKLKKIIVKISKYSFGAYLVHALVLETLNDLGLNTISIHINAIISVPLITVIVWIISYLISMVINHIPYLNKYIV